MIIDYSKIFGHALRYPLRKDVFTVLFVINLFFSVVSWIVTNAFLGDISAIEDAMTIKGIMNFLVFTFPMGIVFFAISVFLMPIFVINAKKFYKGKIENPLDSINIAKERFLSLLLTMGLFVLILAACFSVVFLPAFIAAFLGQTFFAIFAGLWSIIGVFIVIYIVLMIMLSPYICIIEKTGAQNSIKSSWELVSKNKMNTFIFMIIFIVIYFGVYILMTIPSVAVISMQTNYVDFSITGLVMLIITSVLGTYSALFTISATTNYYISIKPGFSVKSILKKK